MSGELLTFSNISILACVQALGEGGGVVVTRWQAIGVFEDLFPRLNCCFITVLFQRCGVFVEPRN